MILRLIEIAKETEKSIRKFEVTIGVKTGYLNAMKAKNSFPGGEVIQKIHEVYPSYNLSWIISGEGNKMVDEEAVLKTELKLSTMLRSIIREENDLLNKSLSKKIDELIASS